MLENDAFVIELIMLKWGTVASMQQVLKLICLLHKGNHLEYLTPFSLKWSSATYLVAYGGLFFKKEVLIKGKSKEASISCIF